MDKGDYNRLDDKLTKQNDKLDKQMLILTSIQLEVGKEITILKIAQEKLKYTSMVIGGLVTLLIAVEFPKLMKYVRGLI